jgi:hypothetical protein
MTGNLPRPPWIDPFRSRRLGARQGRRRAGARGRLSTYALAPAFPVLLLMAAVVVPSVCRRSVTARRFPALGTSSSVTACLRSVSSATITAATDPEGLLTPATTPRMESHSTSTHPAPSSPLAVDREPLLVRRFPCVLRVAVARCGSPDQKPRTLHPGFFFHATPAAYPTAAALSAG